MPSEAFMKSVLGSEEAEAARDEAYDEVASPEQDAPDEPVEEEPGTEEDGEEEEDAAEGDEADAEEDADEDEGEADEEPQAVHEDEGDYGPFQSVEELRRGYKETRAFAQEQSRTRAALERELQEARELLAYQSGRAEVVEPGARASATSEQFVGWAEEIIEVEPERGMAEVHRYGEETGDWSYAVAYTDLWGETDPYRAANARNYVNMAIALGRGAEQAQTGVSARPQPEQQGYDREVVADVISTAYQILRPHYPDLAEGSPVLGGVVGMIQEDQRLHEMVRSGNLEDTTWAIEMARERHLARNPQRRGRPQASRATRQQVESEKTRMPSGDSARPSRRAVSNGEVPEEFQGAMEQFAKWGMVREE